MDKISLHLRPATLMPGMLVGISIPYLHFSASRSKSKQPVPAGASCPSMMFSDTPFMGSLSPCEDASISTSTWRQGCKDIEDNVMVKPLPADKRVSCGSSSHRLLKGTLHQWPCVLTVDAVTRDGHQVTAAGHCVTEQSQVTVVDVGTVKGYDVVQLPLQSLSYSFNAQDLCQGNSRRDKMLTPRKPDKCG